MPASAPGWPTYERDTLDVRAVDVEWSSALVSETAEFQSTWFGEDESAVWDIADPRAVRVSVGKAPTSSWEYVVTDPERYAGGVVPAGAGVMYLAEVPSVDQIAIAGPAGRLVRLDVPAQSAEEVAPPEGMEWSPWPGNLVAGTGTVWVASDLDGSGDCLVGLDPSPQVLACFDEQFVAFVTPYPDGASVLTFPAGENIIDCRRRWHVPATGEPTSIGPADGCTRFDGVVLDGWQLWSAVDPGMPEALYQASLLADGPKGEELSLGLMRTGSMLVCGGYAYWQAATEGAGSSQYRTLRWRPGMREVERVFEDAERDVYSGALRCAGDLVNLTKVASLATPPTEEFLTLATDVG